MNNSTDTIENITAVSAFFLIASTNDTVAAIAPASMQMAGKRLTLRNGACTF